MVKKSKKEDDSCCGSPQSTTCCCRVDSVISVDERGQMVLPKAIRDEAGIRPGDKLAVVNWNMGGKGSSCIILIKAEELASMVQGMLGPVMKEMPGK